MDDESKSEKKNAFFTTTLCRERIGTFLKTLSLMCKTQTKMSSHIMPVRAQVHMQAYASYFTQSSTYFEV